jgi:hypothetical protein
MTRLTRATVALAALVLVGTVPSSAAAQRGGPRAERERAGLYDARQTGRPAQAAARRGAERARRALDRSLGSQGVVEFDAATGTPRFVGKLNGFLTGRSDRSPRAIALGYVRAHDDVFGLDADDLEALELVSERTSLDGVRHLRWAQTYEGIPAMENGLVVNAFEDGRILNVLGSPVPDLSAPSTEPGISARAALAKALDDVGAPAGAPPAGRSEGRSRKTRFAGGHSAELAILNEAGDGRLVWRLVANDRGRMYDVAIDARSGRVMRRKALFADANALVHEFHPGAANGGTQVSKNITGYLSDGTQSAALTGPFAHVWRDIDGGFDVDASEEVAANSVNDYDYPFTAFNSVSGCDSYAGYCSWNPATPFSWQTNDEQNATQVFWFVNNFHDHLENTPAIAFNDAAGNFEDTDAVNAAANLGADTDPGTPGLPSDAFVNNAFMSTPPDGQPPFMGMFLERSPFLAVNTGDDASTVYHEYTHGLSNRLVVDAMGVSTLISFQATAMGEGWSDWYAMDYLVEQGLAPDTAADGEVKLDQYDSPDLNIVRTQPFDCPVGSADPDCPGLDGPPNGGYTYDDYADVYGFPEEHGDGEIWVETLWDLRNELTADHGAPTGIARARSIVTRAMELAPADPSFLDMRNAILQADEAGLAGADEATIWQVFAERGMGFFASTIDSADTAPVADFQLPPAPGTPTGTITGTVTGVSGPLQGASVYIGGFASDHNATTDASGQYTISDVVEGTYPQLAVKAAGGYEVAKEQVDVQGNQTTTRNFTLVRDWAAAAGGGQIAGPIGVGFNGPDYEQDYGCGPSHAIDLSLATGWGSNAPAVDGQKFVVILLPQAVDVTSFKVDPGATCTDPDSASTAGYRIETSTGTSVSGPFTTAAQGTFNASHNHKLNTVAPTAGQSGVRLVKFWMLSNQGHAYFMDMSEIEVLGTPASTTGTGGGTTGGTGGTGGTTIVPPPPPPPTTTTRPIAPPPAGTLRARIGPVQLFTGTGRPGAAAAQLVDAARRRLTLGTLYATAPAGVAYDISVASSALRASASRTRRVLLGGASITMTTGQKRTLRLRISRTAARALARRKRVKVTLRIAVSETSGRITRATRTFTVRVKRR